MSEGKEEEGGVDDVEARPWPARSHGLWSSALGPSRTWMVPGGTGPWTPTGAGKTSLPFRELDLRPCGLAS